MANFLEQLAAEWYEFQGYFVRRNVRVGPRAKGGHEGELDVVAFHPERRHLVHIEPSMDSNRWDLREERFARKFEAGRRHIPTLFQGFGILPKPEHIALLVYGSSKQHPTIGGGKVLMISELLNEIRATFRNRDVGKAATPEQYVILRALQFGTFYWK